MRGEGAARVLRRGGAGNELRDYGSVSLLAKPCATSGMEDPSGE